MKITASPIIITGGAHRIGLAIAKDLHKANYPIIITYRTRHKEIDALEKCGIRCIYTDFSKPQAIDAFINKIKQDYTSIRGIIHNASQWLPEASAPSLESCLDAMMHIHVKVPYLINHALQPLLEADKETISDIIHITDAVVEKGSEKHIAYAASKAALSHLTLSFAKRMAPKVKVNNIAPGLLLFNDNDSDDYKEKALNKSLMGCTGGSDEAVAAVKFLLDSNFVTGRTLTLDGGRHIK